MSDEALRRVQVEYAAMVAAFLKAAKVVRKPRKSRAKRREG